MATKTNGTLGLVLLLTSALVGFACDGGTGGNQTNSSTSSSDQTEQKKEGETEKEKSKGESKDLNSLKIQVPDRTESALLGSLAEIPEGKYLLTRIRTNLALEEYQLNHLFEQRLATPGKPANKDPIQGGRLGDSPADRLESGVSLWPAIEFNLALSIVSEGGGASFSDVVAYGNQWYSEGQRYRWWYRGDETSTNPYLHKIFSEGVLAEGGRYFSSNLGEMIENGIAAVRVEEKRVDVWYSYEDSVVALMSEERSDHVDGKVIVELSYERTDQ